VQKEKTMNMVKTLALAAFAVLAIGVMATGTVSAGEAERHVVADQEIQAKIDQQLGQADADRQAIQGLLQRAEVREIAGAAGLDLERASDAAAVLSGPALAQLAAQARTAEADLAGGDRTIVVSATLVIIVLLILILLLD
jgi:hypothetical protein